MPGNSPRSAHATIRGYLHQTCLGVLRWLDLKDDEVLVCEGDEDLDRHLLDGTVVSEQVKAYSGRLGLGDQAVLDSLFNFLRTYVALRREGADRKFIFTTTAEPRKQRKTGLDFDLLEKWRDGIRTPEVIEAVRSLLEPEDDAKHRDEILAAHAWLDGQPEGWPGFMNAVEWTFGAPDLDQIRRTIQSHLARGEKTRNLDADLFTDRLVVHVLEASSQPDINCRTLSPAALSSLVEEDLSLWANSPRGRRIREAFDEVAEIQKGLLNTGTDKPKDHKPGTLLTAAHEVIPFDEAGRQKELELLARWCEEPEPRSVLLLTGEGGSGKTRLMIEWCRRLRHQGWHAGFLRRDRQAIELDPFLKGTAPRLVVVDYAETQMAVVKPLLQKLASAEPGVGPKVRVVLLARRKGDWWQNLSEEDGEIARLPMRSEAITPLIPSDLEKRQEVFHRAMEGFAAQTRQPVPSEPPLPDLTHKDFERVLFLHMAALASLQGERIGNASEALQTTLVHERRFWKKQVADLSLSGDLATLLEQALEIAVAAVTLVQGCPTKQEAEALVVRCLRDLPLEKRHPKTVLGFLRNLYGGSGGESGRFIDPLQPDLLGEELVEKTLARDPILLGRILDQCSPREAYSTLIVLSRLVRRVPQAEEWIRILVRELEGKGTQETWAALQNLCDDEEYQNSVPLREIAHIATAERVKIFRQRSDELAEIEKADYAGLLNNLGNRLSDLGLHQEALQSANQAVGIHRYLSQTNPKMFLPYLAMSLNNLSVRLNALGQREEALKAIEEAVQIRRQLAQSRPNEFLPDLALSLDNQGNVLSDLGQREEAKQATDEAVKIYSQLAQSNSDKFLPALAASLDNLGSRFHALGRLEDALQATQEAVRIRKQLAQARPDAFLPGLAVSLNNLSVRLTALGRPGEAVQASDEAVRIRRQLAHTRPKAFLPDLASSLTNLGLALRALQRREEALAATNEAIGIYRKLVHTHPNAFLSDLATSLGNLSLMLRDLGQGQEALHAAEDAVSINRQLAQAKPDAFLPNLAASLGNFGICLYSLGRPEEALRVTEEAIRILTPFFLQLPAAFWQWIRMMLRDYHLYADAAKVEPNEALLSPLIQVLLSFSPGPS